MDSVGFDMVLAKRIEEGIQKQEKPGSRRFLELAEEIKLGIADRSNTGVPGVIKGYGKERVIHSPNAGTVKHVRHLTDIVKKGEVIAYVDQTPIYATMDGLLRGLIKEGFVVTQGFKMADIDPREDEYENCFTISDKARCIAGGVIEAIFYLKGHRNDLS